MKPLEIKGARTRLGLSQKYMAQQLNITEASYGKKERGLVRFTDPEKVTVARLLSLTAAQVNDYFFDGMMPIS
ncbi:hypothetical protein [Anaerotruncus colihominis]|jgi:DNA-binding XRE family transcriptional regulator|uniref:helix-turn-helix domain-containing protein n=1 Tax=Anaerotruncus colihominis TaxID=169435 RepID=UPI00206678CA|nr:hypothetical protein [Anaerotruncus colihominis]DAL77012.1 MAG TPA: putative transcriptional regulator [Caudoviricetes sp.]